MFKYIDVEAVWKGHPESCVHRLEVKVCLPIMYHRVLQG